ncbi:MAG: cation:proton antiporter [Proteobacteria bacterium]|nr:cation:proton antiporter [Pseudomonadota bacterium]
MEIQSELTAIAVVVLAALFCGLLCTRFGLPSIIGYIFAGVVLGPSGFSVVEDRGQIGLVAELGVLLLLFTIGMHLSLRGFRAIWMVSVGTAALQIIGFVGVMMVIGEFFNFSLGTSVLIGFVIALSSTVVAVRMLDDLHLLRTQIGQIAVSILIAQDLAIIPMILIIKSMAGGDLDTIGLLRIVIAAGLLGLIIWYLSRRKRISLPLSGLLARQVDLRPIYGVGLCFAAAAISGFLGLSSAYGAFLAGLVVGNSTTRNIMLRNVGPIQNLLVMAFFLSIGLLVDLQFIWQNLGSVITIVLLITVVKTLFNIGIIRLLGEPWPHAFIAGLLIAQIGEFSFLIGETGFDVGLITADERNLIIAVTVITLLISPLWMATARRVVRLAFRHIPTWQGLLAQFRQGGVAEVLAAWRKAPPSERVALRYFGRPAKRLRRGQIAKEESEPRVTDAEEPSGNEPPSETKPL